MPRNLVPCPLCKKLHPRISQHLKESHGIKDVKERKDMVTAARNQQANQSVMEKKKITIEEIKSHLPSLEKITLNDVSNLLEEVGFTVIQVRNQNFDFAIDCNLKKRDQMVDVTIRKISGK